MKYASAAVLLLPLAAGANDAIGTVAAGGIVLRKTDAVAMKKEVLTVGYRRITVDYEFVNESGADVEETVIFPMPAYPASVQVSDTYYGQPGGFAVTVDGKPVQTRTVLAALRDGVDVTAQLRKAGLSDAQIAYGTLFSDRVKVPPLTAQQRQQLGKLGLFGDERTGEPDPLWDVQFNYVWQQRFPANQVVRVHHTYRPLIGTGPGEWTLDAFDAKQYCADPAFLKSWHRLAARHGNEGGRYLPSAKVAYILKSGNSWKRGIEDFTLNLVKSNPAELVSLCFPGTFKKVDANTYQVRLKNFQPTSDLDVYFGNLDDAGASEADMPRLNK
jgi:hypothetical protein